jgi:hypothetical protein
LYAKVRKMLHQEGRYTSDIKDIKLLFKNAIMNEKLSLKEAGIDKNSMITVVYELKENIQHD